MNLKEWAEVDQFDNSGILVPNADPPMLRRNLSTDELRKLVADHPIGEVRAMARDLLAERGLAP